MPWWKAKTPVPIKTPPVPMVWVAKIAPTNEVASAAPIPTRATPAPMLIKPPKVETAPPNTFPQLIIKP